jgi:uncharacterized membrane protein
MKQALVFAGKAILSGVLIVVPIYLTVLLLLKAMKTVATLVRPLSMLLPEWFPAEKALSLLLVLLICFLIGVAVRTSTGRRTREKIEKSLFERIPGYALFRGMTQQMAGDTREKVWKPALVEIEDARVPGFIIEELDDGRYTVFVPSAPTPLAGAIYILDRGRVHPLDVPFTQALQVVSRWGLGAKALDRASAKTNVVA